MYSYPSPSLPLSAYLDHIPGVDQLPHTCVALSKYL
nr:MAG TPA: hypothetical protein [Bacteriophage sp.]